jgi:Xaa-Pro aminopeptidase
MDNSRLKNLQKSLQNPILIKKKENLFYLTGRSFDYRAEEYLLVTKKDLVGFGSGLESMDWIKKSDRLKNIGLHLKGYNKLDIEYGFTFAEGKYLKLKSPGVKIQPSRSPVDVMRQIKEPGEIAAVRKSMQIVEKVFALVRREIKKPKMTEMKLASFIQNNGIRMGARDMAFPPIVASGANAAIPHHAPSAKRLKPGESIIIDFGFSAGGGSAFGGKYQNYCSDFTRTVFLKKVPKKLEVAYNQVEKAYNASMEYVSFRPNASESRNPGRYKSGSRIFLAKPQSSGMTKSITGNDVYQKSVEILAEKKLDKYFIHSLGHGTGLEIHELPNLSPNSKDILKNGMVFSIEPGVYMPKIGGIRIEDLVYLENGKVKKFINISTKLTENIYA